MAGYKPYLPKHLHAAFDDFLELYAEHGLRSSDPEWLASRLDPDEVDKWRTDVVGEARLTGDSDPHARLVEMDRDGRAGEILFPDFGRPFELGTPIRESLAGYTRKPEHIAAGLPAHNRWLAEYVSVAPERFGGMANVDFDNVEAAMAEIRWAREAGLRGVLLPTFDDDRPLFSPDFDPIWSLLEDLAMPVNCHVGVSSVSNRQFSTNPMSAVPHPACVLPLFNAQTQFFTHQILNHMIWGGVLERHPRLVAVFTEFGSSWVEGASLNMDYTYDGSYLRRDVRSVLRAKPSEYFARQCYLGSSIFSRAEIGARHDRTGQDDAGNGLPAPRGHMGGRPGNSRVPAGDARGLRGAGGRGTHAAVRERHPCVGHGRASAADRRGPDRPAHGRGAVVAAGGPVPAWRCRQAALEFLRRSRELTSSDAGAGACRLLPETCPGVTSLDNVCRTVSHDVSHS
ncbi:amidohydrolase family protein [Streptomyces sp. NPDC056975]|uniref:amidohydrolase family protein n=1 Tax=Streptomyces sp. NPDC056975 TaxID=3345985 RepID=UPI00363BA01B